MVGARARHKAGARGPVSIWVIVKVMVMVRVRVRVRLMVRVRARVKVKFRARFRVRIIESIVVKATDFVGTSYEPVVGDTGEKNEEVVVVVEGLSAGTAHVAARVVQANHFLEGRMFNRWKFGAMTEVGLHRTS